ncbi:MAG TPA: SDR family oxidoreductase [Thermoplasmata archaeon]|nr:SDR family oxidoreductase [Thermoplasmata archaeon]
MNRRSRSPPRVSLPPDQGWSPARTKPLRGRVALVAGATRGAGRAIAVSLALAGAKVYATGRSVRGAPATPGRPETIEETAEMIRAFGGSAVALRVDHTVPEEVRRLAARIRRAEDGRLDVLVNDIWGGEELTEWGRPPWAMSWERGRTMLERAVFSHIITSRFLVPLLVARRRGLVVEVTDGAHAEYRGSFYYDLVKSTVIRLAVAYAAEFEEAGLPGLSAIAVTPGFLRSEFMLDQFGVREENWRDAIGKAHHFEASETPYYLARGVVALASDRRAHAKSGRVIGSWTLAREYGFTDRDGSRPNWGAVFARK